MRIPSRLARSREEWAAWLGAWLGEPAAPEPAGRQGGDDHPTGTVPRRADRSLIATGRRLATAELLPRLADAGPPPVWPRFTSLLHAPAVIARVGRVLGTCFLICFLTGLLSAYQYEPWSWLPEPASPVWGYRFTQGLHVSTGILSIPLLLVKLWSVYPALFVWPPVTSLVNALERASIALLVSSALVEVTTGLLNVVGWYPWPWSFVFVHHQLGWVIMGSVALHIAVKLPVIREGLATPVWRSRQPVTDLPLPAAGGDDRDESVDPIGSAGPGGSADPGGSDEGGISRRGLLLATAAGTGIVALTTVGQTFTPLEPIGALAPRLPSLGPQGVPINKTASAAGVLETARAADWLLQVRGPTPFSLSLGQLEAFATVSRRIPMACVEGWSVDARWEGIRLLDLVVLAGGDERSRVRVTSLQARGLYRSSDVEGPQLGAALLATHLNGGRLDVDHGYPVRLIAPNRAGVLNTKWLDTVEVL